VEHHVLALDDRTGNVLTTIATFAAVAALVFAVRSLIVVSVLALLLAYLLEPLVSWVQGQLPGRSPSRGRAVAVVYVTAMMLVLGAGYAVGPALLAQLRRLSTDAPRMLDHVRNQGFLAGHGDMIESTATRASDAAAAAAGQMSWLLLVPLVAIFFLNNRPKVIDGVVDLFAQRRDRATVRRRIDAIDTVLAQYTRSQLIMAGLSAAFYSVTLALLGFPYPLALGLLSGAMELIPVVGWMVAAAIVLVTGYLAHAHWIWVAGLIGAWKLVETFVLSPRIMGDRLQLEPMAVIVAMLAGGQVGGLIGAVLSVPAAAVLHILWRERSASGAVGVLTTSTAAPMSRS
jgi:predicted PurR-regulated permease PerM